MAAKISQNVSKQQSSMFLSKQSYDCIEDGDKDILPSLYNKGSFTKSKYAASQQVPIEDPSLFFSHFSQKLRNWLYLSDSILKSAY